MPSLRVTSVFALLCACCAACTPLRLAPNSWAGEPQGATFFAEPVPKLPIWSEPLTPVAKRVPSLTGGARCGDDPGEQARAQCLRGEGLDADPAR
jgi:hypothetical protein